MSKPWYRELNQYQWFVLVVAALGWFFDCLDQQLFNLARRPAMLELLAASPGKTPSVEDVNAYSGYATSIFLLGWATGGLAFGVLGDRIGRATTMFWTILIYSVFTGFSALAVGFWDFAFYRFLTGLGVGGEFAVGVALVAEVMPAASRPYALGALQAFSAIGNLTAAAISIILGELESRHFFESWHWNDHPISVWRLMFVVGIVPSLLAIVIRRRLHEPDAWRLNAEGEMDERKRGSYRELFGNRRWRRNALVGVALAFSGVVGLWAVGFFSTDLIQSVLRKRLEAQGLPESDISGKLKIWTGIAFMAMNVGSFLGIFAFTYLTAYVGRRLAFAITFLAAMTSTAAVFLYLETYVQIFWMVPLMGFCQLALFGGYAIYFPELFPTHLRSTGTSFCYNVGRFVAAAGPSALGVLTSQVFASEREPLRYAGLTLCSVFLVGLLVLPFAPETKGKPLPA